MNVMVPSQRFLVDVYLAHTLIQHSQIQVRFATYSTQIL